MEDIQDIVHSIIKGCNDNNVYKVSEILAAFVARTVVESDTNKFALNKKLTKKDVNEVINRSIEKLCQKDSASLETIKMQVAFDKSYVEGDENIERRRRQCFRQLRDLQHQIINIKPENSSDFDVFTSLYRKIFHYLILVNQLIHSIVNVVEKNDRDMEREMAAAMESVFPRIGLQSFVQLHNDEKRSQLDELANIALGIRLFNRDLGKGGSDIPPILNLAMNDSERLDLSLTHDIEEMNHLSTLYQRTLLKLHKKNEKKKRKNIDIESKTDQLQEELTHRRQYLSFALSLQEDVTLSYGKIQELVEEFTSEMIQLKGLVGSRSAVPKDQVYPMFDTLSVIWRKICNEYEIILARNHTYQSLRYYKNSFDALYQGNENIDDSSDDEAEINDINDNKNEEKYDNKKIEDDDDKINENKDNNNNVNNNNKEDLVNDELRSDDKINDNINNNDDKDPENKIKEYKNNHNNNAVLLSIQSTPEFMDLPLEFQGFCPWSIVNRRGFLVPGKPILGVIRYNNSYFVFSNERGIEEFLNNPEYFVQGVYNEAMKSPQLIHLLRLQNQFPDASISQLIRGGNINPTVTHTSDKKDASTETPTHFVERFIDPSYEWNEWNLRKKAIQAAKLAKCKTSSQQTDSSYYRRENDSQVYLPKQTAAQTSSSRGTNPPRVHTYLAGLRGETKDNGPSKFIKNKNKNENKNDTRPRIVTLTLDI